jgi:hypothetical protein
VSSVLAWGTLLAIVTVAIGVVLGLAGGGAGGPVGRDGGGLLAQIAAGKPASIVSFGLLLLALTPLAQLVAASGRSARRATSPTPTSSPTSRRSASSGPFATWTSM